MIQAEIEEVTEKDCIEYIKNLVLKRTFDGYVTEKETIYGQLQDILKVKYIGLQIKPTTFEYAQSLLQNGKKHIRYPMKNSRRNLVEKFSLYCL